MGSLILDLIFAGRQLAAHRGFALIAFLLLAIGIGVNVTIFSFANGLLLRPLPYPHQERIVWVDERTQAAPGGMSVSYANFADWQARQRVFESMAAYAGRELTFSGDGEAECVQGVLATGELFRVLGVTPAAGRRFGPDDDKPGAPPVIVIGHGLWQRRFGGLPVTGRDVIVDGTPRTVIGVLPAGFDFPDSAQAWAPMAVHPATVNRAAHGVFAIAALKPGIPIERARSEMSRIAEQLRREHPAVNAQIDTLVAPIRDRVVDKSTRQGLLVLLGATVVFLLIACANLANLLLARAIDRGREMAVRTALGASHWRILRQLLTEGALLAAFGTAGGLLLGGLGRDALMAFIPGPMPEWIRLDIDGSVVAFAVLLAAGTTLLFTLAPSLRAARPLLPNTLREARARGVSKGDGRFFSLLVAAQVALAFVLLAGAGLMGRSSVNLLRSDPGFQPENVLKMRVNLSGNSYASPEARRRFITELVDRLDALPGVRQAGAASVLPTGGANWVPQVIPEGTAASSPSGVFVASQIVATPGHFGALGIRVTRGRDFSAQDGPDSPGVVIVNEALARRHWPSGDPIGRRLRYRMGPGNDSPWLTVVGVVSDVLYAENDVQRAVTYLPHRQQPARTMNLAIGTAADPLSLAAPVRQVIADLDAGLAPTRIQSMERTLSDSRWQPLLIGWMFGLFGVLALILAAVGIYGVVAYSVSRRTHEIGIRIALGAETGRVRRSLLSRTLATVSAGIAAGLLAAYWVGGLLRPLLYGLSPGDPITLGGTTLVLLGVAAGACYAPARAASRIDPLSALRCE